jgi:class 3 adenylate cyclase
MGLSDDLAKEMKEIFATNWAVRDGQKVPEPEDVKLGNDAVKLNGTVLYADLAESTDLVNGYKNWFAAEVYKAYLRCASRIIRDEGGVITAFDGDRVMGVFIGDSKNTSAVRCALKINHAVIKMINTSINNQFKNNNYTLRHAVGVDTSELFVARTGIRGSNDLVWVGRAANYAAKLCSLRDGNYASWITDDVYENMHDIVKFTNSNPMWERRTWTARDIEVHRSHWMWEP